MLRQISVPINANSQFELAQQIKRGILFHGFEPRELSITNFVIEPVEDANSITLDAALPIIGVATITFEGGS